MTPKEKYIEDVGLLYEKYGLPKMAGRILGYLMSASTKNTSFENLQEALKASKGSISGNINLLLRQSLIEKHMISGDRKSYYKVVFTSLNNILEAKVKSIAEFKQIYERGITLVVDEHSHNYKYLSEVLEYYKFLEEEMPLLKRKWEEKIKKNETP